MIFTETKLKGAFIVKPDIFQDERGFFARSWLQHEFAQQGLDTRLVECNISFNRLEGTLRGMHYQSSPHGQAKLVRCTMGAIYDVMIDLRPDSPTYKQWVAEELTAKNHLMLYVPEGFAHGFQTLEDDTEVFYQVSESYAPGTAGGVRWDDPAFAICWPATADMIINERDRTYPDFRG